MLIVLAQRPQRSVAIGAVLFAVVCVVIGAARTIEMRQQLLQQKALMACMQKNGSRGFAACANLMSGDKMGFVGNEAYGN